jgi:hypothetical protein
MSTAPGAAEQWAMSTTDKLAIAALVVSVAAFFLSVGLAVWEGVKFWREGARA